MDFLVDPVLYAVPAVNGNSEVLLNYLEHLSRWSAEIRAQRHNFFVWFDCMDALAQAGCYPNHQNLKQLWLQSGEQMISPDIVLAACRRLLDPPYLDDCIQDPSLDNMLVDESSFTVHPDLLERLPPLVADAFQDALGKVAYIRDKQPSTPCSDLHLVTHPIGGEQEAGIAAHVVTPDNSADVNAELPLVTTPNDLDALQDLAGMWRDPEEAFPWLLRRLIRKGDLPPDTQFHPYRVGPGFIKAIEDHHFDRIPGRLRSIYRCCVMLLAGLGPTDPKVHHLLQNQKKRRYGDWRAWRLHLSKPPLSLRLHYWRGGGKFILSNIVVIHRDYNIDPPEWP